MHGIFHYSEQKPKASNNTTKTRFLDVPELQFWVGSESANEKLQRVLDGKQEARVVLCLNFDSYAAHFKLAGNESGK